MSLPLCLYPCLIPPLCLCVYVSVIFVPVPCLPYVSGIYTHRGQSWAWGVTTPGFWGGDHWLVVGVVVGGRGLSMKYYYMLSCKEVWNKRTIKVVAFCQKGHPEIWSTNLPADPQFSKEIDASVYTVFGAGLSVESTLGYIRRWRSPSSRPVNHSTWDRIIELPASVVMRHWLQNGRHPPITHHPPSAWWTQVLPLVQNENVPAYLHTNL